ncbi:uncharacterized protein [Mytilus edulis]|uniref:uncharacterized protein n=1 Tax=Mytilus edulis TaxID=6550 RepID=UPI0039F104FC
MIQNDENNTPEYDEKSKTPEYDEENKTPDYAVPTSFLQDGKNIHYFIATGSLVIFFLGCIGILQLLNFRRKRKNPRSNNVSDSEGDQRNQVNNEPNFENFYHEIDDVSGSVSEAIVRHSYMSINSDQSVQYNDGKSLAVDDYLTPCQPATSECKSNCEEVKVTVSNMIYYGNKTNDGDQVVEVEDDDESCHSINSYENKIEGHFRPYQLLIEKKDIHDYADN